ncbi:hypothetical protein K9N68_18165 [Kovacikia minuta CCNUW1]|uniref:hypothetical protein n=1 Tax=Kovacikia minuta TaxID=2931930 RepID=UPI001CCBAEB5|nr:hypothetical protein [Kovacikia minuta]UBF23698.1 hypothetical protein K9N68_18165 [Kovacikia minuta CCNUW1]
MLSLYPAVEYLSQSILLEIKAEKLLGELPANKLNWQERARSHWVNRLPSIAEYLPKPQRDWYISAYKPQASESAS